MKNNYLKYLLFLLVWVATLDFESGGTLAGKLFYLELNRDIPKCGFLSIHYQNYIHKIYAYRNL